MDRKPVRAAPGFDPAHCRPRLTLSQAAILRSAACHGWYVCSDNISDIARLLSLGLVEAEDDYESINVRATKAGEQTALRFGLVELQRGKLEYIQPDPLAQPPSEAP